MFGLSLSHLLLGLLILLVLNPRRLPALGSYLGKAARNFKEGYRGMMQPGYKKLGYTDEKTDKKTYES